MDEIETEDCAMCGDLRVVTLQPSRSHRIEPFCSVCGRRIPVIIRRFVPGDRTPSGGAGGGER